MNAREKIKQLQEAIKVQEEIIKNCKHKFDDPIYDPEEISVPDDHKGYECHGVDRWPIPSYQKETKDRWSRECTICGHKEYTYSQKPIISGYRPDFN
jgi:hypothetical protein